MDAPLYYSQVVLVVVLVEVVVVVVVLVEDFSTPGNVNPWVQLGTIGHWRGDWGLAGPATAKALLYLLNSNLSQDPYQCKSH